MSERHHDREADELLHQLGALEREYDDGFPHEWEDVVRGERSAAEVVAARREAGDDPAEIDALAELLRPTSATEREAWVERAGAALASAGSEPGPGIAEGGGVEWESSRAEASEREEAEVVSLGERRRGPWVAAVVALLAAAALVLWLRPRGGAESIPGAGELPSFTLTVRNELVHEVRSGASGTEEVHQYLPQTVVRWVVSPERSVSTSVGIRILAEAEGDAPERHLIDPRATISDRGVIEIGGGFGEVLGLSPGRWSLRMIVGEALPSDVAELDAGGSWTVVEPAYEIVVVEDEPQ